MATLNYSVGGVPQTPIVATEIAAGGGGVLAGLSAAGAALGPIGMAIGIVGGMISQNKAAKKAKQAARMQRRIQRMQIAEGNRARLRQAVATASMIENTAAQTGTQGSSGELGAVGSVASQYGSAVAFTNATERMSMRAGGLEQKAANYTTAAKTFGDLYDISKWAYSL